MCSMPRDAASEILTLRQQLTTLQARLATVEGAYSELIMAVGNKYPGESRHATALRYIQKAEAPTNQQAAAALDGRPGEEGKT